MQNKLRMMLAALSMTSVASADDTVSFGYSGLLTVPTANVLDTGWAEIQYSEHNFSDRNVSDATTFNAVFGLAPRLELGAALAYESDPSNRFGFRKNDLLASAKLKLIDDFDLRGLRWSSAIGWSDFGGKSDAARFSSARYWTNTVSRGPVAMTLGYGLGPDRLDGVFGGLSWSPVPQATLMADYDGDFATVGVKLSLSVADYARLYALGLNAFDKEDPTGFAGGARVNLRFDRQSDWFQPDGTRGIRVLSSSQGTAGAEIAAENTAYLQRQQDSASAACATAGSGNIVYRQYRYGIPMLAASVDCQTGTFSQSRWISQLSQPSFADDSMSNPFGVEARFGVEERTFIGTELGRLQYSAAIQSSLRVQGPLGAGAYITRNTRVANHEAFEDDRPFSFYRVRDGVREVAAQLATHPIAGLVAVGTVGRTYVNALEYEFSHLDGAYFWGQGNHRTRVSIASYAIASRLPFPDREVKVASHRYWYAPWNTSFEIGGGDYFYGDRGAYTSVTRYFGDVTLSIIVRSDDDDRRDAGIALGFPLTPRLGFQRGPFAVVGAPRYTHTRRTTFDNPDDSNALRPLFMVEPRPVYNLQTDWLDSDRMYPAYQNESRE